MEDTKRQAIVEVLSRLGEAMHQNVERTLREGYKIDLRRNDYYTLEELHIALQRMFGSDCANLLMREIYRNIGTLAKKLD